MATTKNAQSTQSGPTIVGRAELTRKIATQSGLTQKKASEVLEATLDTIRDSLMAGNEVRLVGFGSFKVRESAARKGVNPRDRKPINVPAKNRVRFSPGKELADAVVTKSKGK
jgi:DNA-binding protein HU-beta